MQPVHRPFAGSGGGGLTGLGPNQTIRTAPPPQEYYCVRISILAGDPNSNGGRDSNGYYVAYLEGMRYPPSPVVASPTSVECRVYYDSGTTLFADGTRLMAYHFQMTVSSPDSSDDGFMLLMPCYPSLLGAGDMDFHLTGTLTTTDATTTSFSVDAYHNGVDPTGTVTLQNMQASSNYIFSGASGAAGWATLITFNGGTGDATYRIRQMECP